MQWTVHGETPIYESPWVTLSLADVEVPDGKRFDHHVIRSPKEVAGVVVYDRARGVLLLWRHRFITDSWGWEIPAGGVETGESPEAGAIRETIEETGWNPRGLRPLISYHPMNGIADQVFRTFIADGADYVGEPTDSSESERIEWVPIDSLRQALRSGEVLDGMSVAPLTYALAFDLLD